MYVVIRGTLTKKILRICGGWQGEIQCRSWALSAGRSTRGEGVGIAKGCRSVQGSGAEQAQYTHTLSLSHTHTPRRHAHTCTYTRTHIHTHPHSHTRTLKPIPTVDASILDVNE